MPAPGVASTSGSMTGQWWQPLRTKVIVSAQRGATLEKRRGKSMLSSIEICPSTSKMKLRRKRRAGCVAGDDYHLILVVKDAHSVLPAIPPKQVFRGGHVLFEDQTGMHV